MSNLCTEKKTRVFIFQTIPSIEKKTVKIINFLHIFSKPISFSRISKKKKIQNSYFCPCAPPADWFWFCPSLLLADGVVVVAEVGVVEATPPVEGAFCWFAPTARPSNIGFPPPNDIMLQIGIVIFHLSFSLFEKYPSSFNYYIGEKI